MSSPQLKHKIETFRPSDARSCAQMCCGRGYTTMKTKIKERCKCKFHWCCYVECEECVRDVQISTCN